MDKKVLLPIFCLLLISSVLAEDIIIEKGDLTKLDTIQEQAQQSILQTSNISTKLDEIAAQNTKNLETAAIYIIQNENQMQSTLIVMVIVVSLASQGLWWAVFLYFQTKGLLPALNTKKSKPVEKNSKKKKIDLTTVFGNE